jgi:ankyrin repeat protein
MNLSELLQEYSDLPEFLEIDSITVDTVGNFGNTPLHVAACRGAVTEVNLLISSGANVNAVGELGNTPLHEAVGQNMLDAAEALLKAGAKVDAKNDFGTSVLALARKPGRHELKRLLEQYAGK